MTRLRPERHAALGVLGLTVVVLAAACSGVGVQRAVNYYQLACSDQKAYLQAVDIGDDAKVAEAVARMERDFRLIPDRQPRVIMLEEVAAASKGDPSLIRRDYRANCLPLPSPSPTTPAGSPSST